MRTCLFHSGLSNKDKPVPVILISRLLLLGLMFSFSLESLAELSMAKAEKLALTSDPAILAQQSKADSLSAEAIAKGQLPDPKIGLSLVNVPVNDFDLEREPSTQFRTKILQSFPRGDTLKYQQEYMMWLGKAKSASARDVAKQIRRDVRSTFLELYYQTEAEKVIRESRELFKQMVDVTEVMFSSGRVSQQDVLGAQLELSRLDERAIKISARRDIQRAKLARWLGADAAEPIDTTFPVLPQIRDKESLYQNLLEHPFLANSTANIKANEKLIDKAREQYKPGWNVGLEYRKRFGTNQDGSNRDDMMAAVVSFDLPIFTDKRQDKTLIASQRQADAARQQNQIRYLELKRMLDSDYSQWQHLGDQEKIYRDHLLKKSSATTKAAIHAYRSGNTEYPSLIRATVTDLNVKLQSLRIKVDRAKAQARILYLTQNTNEEFAVEELTTAKPATQEGDSK